MIGILFLIGIIFWFVMSMVLSAKIPRWLGVRKYGVLLSVLLFPCVLIAPVADEIIGRWQFNCLCEREAVVKLSPDWEKVKRAQNNDDPITEIGGYVIPIRIQKIEYVDLDSGQPFLSFKAFHTHGGFLMGRLGFGLGNSTSCWPKDWVQVTNKLNTDQLLKQGKAK